ncbi:uncharacterized protein LOC106673264 isoform X4 [Cimex lectularius]|uniref:Uncharacterized protein n=1 Tax=Cimex lectularius TaxID=79782 RepID=A0A8I6SC49_CIMLE|nr:uncharacterized protein LOC106673264 isoform X4 [Cimex lectularius]
MALSQRYGLHKGDHVRRVRRDEGGRADVPSRLQRTFHFSQGVQAARLARQFTQGAGDFQDIHGTTPVPGGEKRPYPARHLLLDSGRHPLHSSDGIQVEGDLCRLRLAILSLFHLPAPKAEVSTKLAIVETTEKVSADGKHSMIPATVSSRSCTMRKKTDAKIIRQHPVCHTKNNVYCKCLNGPRVSSSMKLFSGGDSKKSEKSRRLIKSGGSSPMSKKRCDDCSSCSSIFPFESRSLEKSPSQKGSVREYIVAHHYATRTNKVPVVSGPELDSICDCQLCKRYELYFRERTDDGRRSCCKCACNQPSSESALSNPKMARSRSGDHECHSPVSIGSISSSDDDVVFYCHCHRSLGKGRTASGYTIDEGDSDPTSKGGQDECRRFMKFQEQEREKKAKPDKKKQPSRRGHVTLLVEKNSKLGKWGVKTLQ